MTLSFSESPGYTIDDYLYMFTMAQTASLSTMYWDVLATSRSLVAHTQLHVAFSILCGCIWLLAERSPVWLSVSEHEAAF